MIIESLSEYHKEQVLADNLNFAPNKMELKMIHYVVVLDFDGLVIDIEKHKERQFVAKSCARSGKNAASIANRLWDHTGYVFGFSANEKAKSASVVQSRSFVNLVKEIAEANPTNRALQAVVKFYERGVERIESHPLWGEITSKVGQNISFRIDGEEQIVAQDSDVVNYGTQTKVGSCIVTGQPSPLIYTHPKVRIYGGASVGSKLVSFNKESGYDSYQLKGTQNAPMSVVEAESYASALNGLLQFDGKNKIIIGSVSFVFFTLPNCDLDSHFSILMGATDGSRQETIDRLKENRHLYANNEMVVMAFVPNMSRISVRMGVRIKATQFIDNILKFYDDTHLNHNYNVVDAMTILMPLFSITFKSEVSNLPPQLIVDYVEAVLLNKQLPAIFQQELLKVARETTKRDLTICSMIKCYLVRNRDVTKEEVIKSKGYNLGAMLSIMDRVKRLSRGGNSSAKFSDIYYKTLSTNPSMIFDRMVKLSYMFVAQIRAKTHLAQIQSHLETSIAINSSGGAPDRLSPDEQCYFALGYFSDRQNYIKQR